MSQIAARKPQLELFLEIGELERSGLNRPLPARPGGGGGAPAGPRGLLLAVVA